MKHYFRTAALRSDSRPAMHSVCVIFLQEDSPLDSLPKEAAFLLKAQDAAAVAAPVPAVPCEPDADSRKECQQNDDDENKKKAAAVADAAVGSLATLNEMAVEVLVCAKARYMFRMMALLIDVPLASGDKSQNKLLTFEDLTTVGVKCLRTLVHYLSGSDTAAANYVMEVEARFCFQRRMANVQGSKGSKDSTDSAEDDWSTVWYNVLHLAVKKMLADPKQCEKLLHELDTNKQDMLAVQLAAMLPAPSTVCPKSMFSASTASGCGRGMSTEPAASRGGNDARVKTEDNPHAQGAERPASEAPTLPRLVSSAPTLGDIYKMQDVSATLSSGALNVLDIVALRSLIENNILVHAAPRDCMAWRVIRGGSMWSRH